MGRLILIIILAGTIGVTLVRPWIGVIAYYTLAIMIPNMLWPWVFRGIRVSFLIGAVTIASTLIAVAVRKLDLKRLRDKQSVFILLMWLSLTISYYFGAYGQNNMPQLYFNSKYLITHYHKLFAIFFAGVLCLDTQKKVHFSAIMFLFVIAYYVYWANHQYLAGLWNGLRLGGPGGIYKDENTFAVLFVSGIPFLFYFGLYYKSKLIRYALWGLIPFAWHAIFLTGSLGGTIGLVVVTLFMVFRGSNKKLKIIIPIILFVAVVTQGGRYLKSKLGLATQGVTQVATAQSRLESWRVGLNMLVDYPITGVGLGCFVLAYPKYSSRKALVAHNTFLQYGSQSGVMAGLMYLILVYGSLRFYFKDIRGTDRSEYNLIMALNDAVAGAIIGFFVCSMFLNLAIYEIFYFFILLSFAIRKLKGREGLERMAEENEHSLSFT